MKLQCTKFITHFEKEKKFNKNKKCVEESGAYCVIGSSLRDFQWWPGNSERERERDWESVCILGDRRSFFFFFREREREREVWLWLDISGAWGWGWGWAGRRYSLNLQIPSGKSHLLFPLFFSLLPRSLFLLISTCCFHCLSLFLIFSTLFKKFKPKKKLLFVFNVIFPSNPYFYYQNYVILKFLKNIQTNNNIYIYIYFFFFLGLEN